MEENKLKGLKRSDVLKIEAAIVEIMEEANFDVSTSVEVQKGDVEGNCKMVFAKTKTSLNELEEISTQLGQNFAIAICPRAKKELAVIIEADEGEFIKLLQKDIPQRPVNANGNHA